MSMSIGFLDAVIIFMYLAVVMCIGFYFTRREKTSTDYFLAGRHVGWIAIGASLFASNISSEHFVGLAGAGASSGLAVGNFEWLAAFCLMTLGWVFVPFYLRSGVFTMPEFLERRYNDACRWYLTIISIIAYIVTKISITLVAGSFLLREVVGWNVYISSLALIVATAVYTFAGGLSAVIYTELLQTFVLIGGALLLTWMGFQEVGGWQGLTAALDPEHFSMFKAMSHPDFPWTGIIFGAPILGIWYWCTDQFIVQRVLSAKDEDNAKSGTIFAGYLKLLPVFIMVFPGLIAAALFADVRETADLAYPALVTRILPIGLKGIVIAGLLAAIMSSLASCFNSTSTLITMDVYSKFNPDATERQLVRNGRIFTIITAALAIAWIPFIEGLIANKGLYVYLQSVQAYISPPIAAVFLFGVFFSRLNGAGAITSLLLGFLIGSGRFVLEILTHAGYALPAPLLWIASINFLHFAILLFAICSIALFIVSYLTEATYPERLRGLTFDTIHETVAAASFHDDLPEIGERRGWFWANVIFSVVLVLTILVLWYIFF